MYIFCTKRYLRMVLFCLAIGLLWWLLGLMPITSGDNLRSKYSAVKYVLRVVLSTCSAVTGPTCTCTSIVSVAPVHRNKSRTAKRHRGT
jgi:hypothetical protein